MRSNATSRYRAVEGSSEDLPDSRSPTVTGTTSAVGPGLYHLERGLFRSVPVTRPCVGGRLGCGSTVQEIVVAPEVPVGSRGDRGPWRSCQGRSGRGWCLWG